MQVINTTVSQSTPSFGYLTLRIGTARKTFELAELTTIGRDVTTPIHLDDPLISNRHARIERRADGFYIRDLRSKTGTFLNGTYIIEAKLQNFDRIKIGSHDFTFSVEKEQETSSTVHSSLNNNWDLQLKKVSSMAQSAYPVLISGPSGSGKELIANQIHKMSLRANGPFLSVNCSALTESLAESELFGHKKGSFTGSQEARKGAFAACDGGTLFLDEVGDMPLCIQPKFLRALENKEIKAVGSDFTEPTDVRIIAATNCNLVDLVNKGKFREDLYYRIHILQIRVPSLKERFEDFDNLLQGFARPLRVRFTPDALIRLREHNWPGNIRELKNVVSRAAAIFPDMAITKNEVSEILDLPRQTANENEIAPRPVIAKQYLKEYEREAIIERLSFFDGNQRKTAEDMGLAKSTLHDRIQRYGINAHAFKRPYRQTRVPEPS